jgi:hypothetical protein
MHYLLTREELDALVSAEKLKEAKAALEIARKAILQAAGHTCIHEPGARYGYCDTCPVSQIGHPDFARCSGDVERRKATDEERAADRLICAKSREYGK